MSRPFHRLGRRPQLVAIAAILLLKALVPSGWMPMAQDGSVRIVPCGGWAPAPRAVVAEHHDNHAAPSAGHGQHHEDGQSVEPPCAFAGLGLAWTLPPPFASAAALAPQAAMPGGVHHRLQPGRGLAAPPPPATGPPLTA